MNRLKKIISHRGNLIGRNVSRENSPSYLIEALDRGFDVEVDVWIIDNKCFLGHDGPQYQIDSDFLTDRKDNLWVHAKNLQAASYLRFEDLNWFWHENDKMVLTSKGFPWCNFNVFVRGGVTVEFDFISLPDYVYGVCTDNPIKYK